MFINNNVAVNFTVSASVSVYQVLVIVLLAGSYCSYCYCQSVPSVDDLRVKESFVLKALVSV